MAVSRWSSRAIRRVCATYARPRPTGSYLFVAQQEFELLDHSNRSVAGGGGRALRVGRVVGSGGGLGAAAGGTVVAGGGALALLAGWIVKGCGGLGAAIGGSIVAGSGGLIAVDGPFLPNSCMLVVAAAAGGALVAGGGVLAAVGGRRAAGGGPVRFLVFLRVCSAIGVAAAGGGVARACARGGRHGVRGKLHAQGALAAVSGGRHKQTAAAPVAAVLACRLLAAASRCGLFNAAVLRAGSGGWPMFVLYLQHPSRLQATRAGSGLARLGLACRSRAVDLRPLALCVVWGCKVHNHCADYANYASA